MSRFTCPTCGGRRRKVNPAAGASYEGATPNETSPMRLLQEDLRGEPFHLLVACVLLNRTHARSVRSVLTGIFGRWPTAQRLTQASAPELAEVLRPLGLQNRRAWTLIQLARLWAELDEPRPTAEQVAELPGVGVSVLDSYRIFVEPGRIVEPLGRDQRLKSYVHWARGLATGTKETTT